MAVDFQVVFPQQIIELSSVQVMFGVTPRTLDILGEDFRAIDEVRVNDLVAPNVVVLNKRRMLVRVPELLGESPVTSVTVTSNSIFVSDKSVLKFRVGRVTSKVSGVMRLMQVFLKVLFTTPGRDIFAPRIGAAALKNLGLTFGSEGGKQLVSDFVVAVATASRQIVAIQGRDPSIPFDERLLSAKVVAAKYSRSEEALIVSVELTSQTGRSALANVVV
jgi:hypothetical protein